MFPPSPKRGERLLPLRPLIDLTCISYAELSSTTGYPAKTIGAWAVRGVPMSAADWMACRCGFHPINVWGPAFQDEPHTPGEETAENAQSLF